MGCGVSGVLGVATGDGVGVEETESGVGSAVLNVVGAGVGSGSEVGFSALEWPAKTRRHVVRTKRRIAQELSKSELEKQLFSACERQEFRSCY